MTGMGALAAATPSLGATQQRNQLVGQYGNQSQQWALDRANQLAGGINNAPMPVNHYAALGAAGLNSFGPMAAAKFGWGGMPPSMRQTMGRGLYGGYA